MYPAVEDTAATTASMVARVRSMIGDFAEPFEASVRSDGSMSRYNLPVGIIDPDVVVRVQSHVDGTTAEIPADGYSLDLRHGVLVIYNVPPAEDTIKVTGITHSLFTDSEMAGFVGEAASMHNSGAWTTERLLVDSYGEELVPQPEIEPGQMFPGFIGYQHNPKTVSDLSGPEPYLVSLLAASIALWDLAIDAATDIDVVTAEGTSIPRSQRFRQLWEIINGLLGRYKELSQQLNVGMFRIEVSFLRRVSRTTNRLVPLFVPMEYDDHGPPQRILPPIDARDLDQSGIPSPGIRPLWDAGTGWNFSEKSSVGYASGYRKVVR